MKISSPSIHRSLYTVVSGSRLSSFAFDINFYEYPESSSIGLYDLKAWLGNSKYRSLLKCPLSSLPVEFPDIESAIENGNRISMVVLAGETELQGVLAKVLLGVHKFRAVYLIWNGKERDVLVVVGVSHFGRNTLGRLFQSGLEEGEKRLRRMSSVVCEWEGFWRSVAFELGLFAKYGA